MRVTAAMVSVMVLALLAAGIAYAVTVSIDSFDAGIQELWVDSTTPTDSDSLDTTAALGGERDIYLQWVGGTSGRIYVYTDYGGTSERFSYTAGDGMTGRATVTWDGNNDGVFDPQGLPGVDLVSSSPANDAILARLMFADQRSAMTMRVYADSSGPNWSYSTINLPTLSPGERMDVMFPFSGFTTGGGTGANFANVGAIVMILDGTVAQSADVSIDFIETSNAREYGDLPVITYTESILSANHIPQGLRLGPNCDVEDTYNSSVDTSGDDTDQASPDDEDGVVPTFLLGYWTPGPNGGNLQISPQGCANLGGCYVNGWIDWDNDGSFDDTVGGASEHIVNNVSLSNDNQVTRFFSTPSTFSNGHYYARFRICRTSTACDSPDNTDTNVVDGEVEDYRWYVGPSAVELASFTAEPQRRAIVVSWETVSEVDAIGFNLYRADSRDGTQTKLNGTLIPSQGPGSPIGYSYSFVDRGIRVGRTYYYWLEAIDIYNGTSRFGPVSAAVSLQLRAPKVRP